MSDLVTSRVALPRRRPRIKLALILLFLAYVLWIGVNAALNARELQRRLVCGSNLRGLGAAFKVHGHAWDGQTPPVDWLVAKGVVDPGKAICPSSGLSRSNYVFVRPPGAAAADQTITALEPKSNHNGGGNFLFADGHAQFFAGADYDKIVAGLTTGK